MMMKALKNIVIVIGVVIGLLVAAPLGVAFGAWAAELMIRWGLLP